MHHKTAERAKDGSAAPETAGLTIRWWAPAYDTVTWLSSFGQEKAIRQRTIKVAALQPGERVLDVGCGTGTLAIAAWGKVRPDGQVTGIDASPEMVELARRKAKKNGSGAQFRVAPIEALPLEDGSLDVVLSTFMLHHLPDDVKPAGFSEIARVLKPGGRLVAVDLSGNSRHLISRLGSLFGHLMPGDYAAQLMAGMGAAGLTDAAEVKTRFGYLMFLSAKKGT